MSDDATKNKKPARIRSRRWRIFFTVFKWCRVGILLALLSAVILGLFLNRVGLPGWVHRRVVAQMRARGWDMEFSRLRLLWYRGIVADNLQLSRTNAAGSPHLFVDRAEFRLNGRALRSFDLQADSVLLAGGRLVWPLPGTNQPRQTFTLNKARGELIFKPGDEWELRSFQAEGLGAKIKIRGDITNASLIRDWKLPAKKPQAPREPERDLWRDFLTQAAKVRTPAPPEINVIFSLDAREPRSLDASLKFAVPAIESPWGAATNLSLIARLMPPGDSNDVLQAYLHLTAGQARSPWGEAANVQLTAHLDPSPTRFFPANSSLKLDLLQPRTPWGGCERLSFRAQTATPAFDTGMSRTDVAIVIGRLQSALLRAESVGLVLRATHPSTSFLPASLRADTTLEQARTQWTTSAWARIETSLELPRREEWRMADTNLAWPERLKNIPFQCAATFSNALGAGMEFSHVIFTNSWASPELRASVESTTPAGSLAASVTLDTATRGAKIDATVRCDPHKLAPFLPTNALPWLADYQSAAPLELSAAGSATLPAWTNQTPGWLAATLPTISLAGKLGAPDAAYCGISFTAARTHFAYTNSLWSLPEIRFTRPEGVVEADGEINSATGRFRVKARSTIDPQALRVAFPPRVQTRIFALFEFTAPPLFQGELAGNYRDWTTLAGAGSVTLTNAAFEKQPVRFATTTAEFKDGFLSLYSPLVLRDGERGVADGIGLDVRKQRLYLTNASGNIAPMAVVRSIGPKATRLIAPYVFDVPPQSRAHGSIPLARGDNSEDLRFELDGGPFHWGTLHADTIRAVVLWQNDDLTLTNIQARWRGGDARGWAEFHFNKTNGGTLAFHAAVAGGDLRRIVQDFQDGRTNRLEGTLDASLSIERGLVNDFNSWTGSGDARLMNGLLWDLPVFGVASKALNALFPGLGHSRARQAAATFNVTNGAIHSRDLEIQATGMHLQYRGTIGFDGAIDASVEAQLFRGVPAVGVLISKVFWPMTKLFEYRVTGTLNDPKLDEKYFIPKVLLFPLQPIKTLKNLFDVEEKKDGVNPAKENPPK